MSLAINPTAIYPHKQQDYKRETHVDGVCGQHVPNATLLIEYLEITATNSFCKRRGTAWYPVGPRSAFPREQNIVHLALLRIFVSTSWSSCPPPFRRMPCERLFACWFRHVFLWFFYLFILTVQCFPLRIVSSHFFSSFFTRRVLCCDSQVLRIVEPLITIVYLTTNT